MAIERASFARSRSRNSRHSVTQHQGIRARRQLLGRVAIADFEVRMLLPASRHGDGIVGPHPCAHGQEMAGDMQAGSVAQIVRIRFNRW